jgi:hypothetical protein
MGVSVHGCFTLADGLRPDMTVSRDRLRQVPWSVLSVLHLTIRRAAVAHEYIDPQENLIGFNTKFEDSLLGTIIGDPLLTEAGGWRAQPFIPTSEGALSIDDLAGAVDADPSVRLMPVRTLRQGFFLTTCRAALLQLNLSTAMVRNENGVWCHVLCSGEPAVVDDASLLFPPLFFVPYDGPGQPLAVPANPVNSHHPLSRWLLETAVELDRRFPALLGVLRSGLAWVAVHPDDRVDLILQINATLDRVRQLAPDLAPPRSLRVTQGDFEGGAW